MTTNENKNVFFPYFKPLKYLKGCLEQFRDLEDGFSANEVWLDIFRLYKPLIEQTFYKGLYEFEYKNYFYLDLNQNLYNDIEEDFDLIEDLDESRWEFDGRAFREALEFGDNLDLEINIDKLKGFEAIRFFSDFLDVYERFFWNRDAEISTAADFHFYICSIIQEIFEGRYKSFKENIGIYKVQNNLEKFFNDTCLRYCWSPHTPIGKRRVDKLFDEMAEY